MKSGAAKLPVMVSLTPALLAAAGSGPAVETRIEESISGLLSDLGTGARASVTLGEAADPEEGNGPPIILVGGRRCRYPATLIVEALSYVDGTPEVAGDAGATVAQLASATDDGERLAEWLALVCTAAIAAQPEIVLDPEDDRNGARAALALGISLAGHGDGPQEVETDGDPIEASIAAGAAPTLDVIVEPDYLRELTSESDAGEMFPFAKEGLFTELGLPLPPLHFQPDPWLRPRGFAFRLNEVRTLPRIGLAPGTILVNDTPENLAPLGVAAAPTLNPATAQPAAIASDEHKESLESAGLTTWNPVGFLILCLAAAVRMSAHALMTRDVADGLVGQLGSAFPALQAAADEHVPPDKLAPVLRELLLDGVSVRNLRRILELLIRYETVERANHRTDAVTFVCEGLADLIAFTLARGTSTVVVYLLDPEIENALADGADDTTAGRVSAAVRDELAFLPAMAQVPAILTHDESRRRLRDLLRPEFPRMRVLSYSELPPDYNVQPVARISW